MSFKLRSKLFLSYAETISSVREDYRKKSDIIFQSDTKHVSSEIFVANPAILGPNSELIAALADKFGGKYFNDWDDNCCSVFFFIDNPEAEEEITVDPNSWLIKYEVMFSEDAIELSGNGDFVFSKVNVSTTSMNSTYH